MKTIEIKVNVDTAPIDSLIARLERAVELQKQLTPAPLPAVLAVDKGQTYSLRTGIHIDSFILDGAVPASKIEASLNSIKQLEADVAAIIANAINIQHQLERIERHCEKDFTVLSKALQSVEGGIHLLNNRNSFIR